MAGWRRLTGFMNRLRALFHPILFCRDSGGLDHFDGHLDLLVRQNNENFKEFAQKLRPELLDRDFDWVILAEGCFLMLIILAGVYVIFVYWTKQTRLNRLHSNFVSSVSHELKSPLASLQLYLETMKYREVSPEDRKEFIEMMLADTKRLSGLIDNILQSSKSDSKSMQLQFEPVPIREFLNDILGNFKDSSRTGVLRSVSTPTTILPCLWTSGPCAWCSIT